MMMRIVPIYLLVGPLKAQLGSSAGRPSARVCLNTVPMLPNNMAAVRNASPAAMSLGWLGVVTFQAARQKQTNEKTSNTSPSLSIGFR
jgi:hypothetical protein